jgi:dTDP-3-amino-2,3,6-trideoxy-4-keto-D-glucose/dTDP-3-amino-3,4,6-trideoxy-alpha-D-glucose/dTDP-2,6-dideoxy-D-kanosamine transaminase
MVCHLFRRRSVRWYPPDTVIFMNDLRRLHEPYLAELRHAVSNVIDSGWFVLGEQGRAFEALFAASCGRRYGFGVASGTDAIEVALRAVGVASGDMVATVANAGGYSTAAIFACGATPHYVDVDPDTMNIGLGSVPAALSLRPRALVLTHLYGRLGPVAEVARLCAESGTPLIEDCAQAYGARSNGRAAGAFGALGCYSFYPTKNLGALGDGGAVVTDDDRLAEQILRIRQYGWSRKYCVAETGGRNSRLDEIQAAVLTVKLPYVAAETGRRRAIAARYLNEIRNSAIEVPHRGSDSDAVHLFVVRSLAREALALHLADAGIQTDIHYPIPDHLQPAFAARFAEVALPVTERLATEVLSLPCHPGMTDMEVSHVVGACNAFHA